MVTDGEQAGWLDEAPFLVIKSRIVGILEQASELEGDGAEDTTVTPDITSDDPEMMQGRTDMTEAAESEANTELYPDMEDTTDSLLPPYEDVKPIFLQKQASEIEFLNDDGEIEIQKS